MYLIKIHFVRKFAPREWIRIMQGPCGKMNHLKVIFCVLLTKILTKVYKVPTIWHKKSWVFCTKVKESKDQKSLRKLMVSITFLIFIFIKNLLTDKCQDKLSMFHATWGKKPIHFSVFKDFILMANKVHVFWEGHKNLQNLHLQFDSM